MFRPGDAVETAECWALALENRHAPSILALTRQPLPLLRTEPHRENRSAKGAYVLAEADGARQVTLLATGSEVAIAMEAREALAKDGIRAAVVSMPCWELFESQAQEYRDVVLGTAPRVGVEAAVRFGWDRWLGRALAHLSGCTALAPRRRSRRSTRISASPPRGLHEAARSLL